MGQEKRKLLCVDDDDSILEFLETSLGMAGYDVTAVSNADEALKTIKAQNGAFPVVLSDIMMPGISGLEFVKILKTDFPDILVIMLTAHASVETAIRALNEGAFAYLPKPINNDELKAALRNAYEKVDLLNDKKMLFAELKKANNYLENIVENLVYVVIATDENCRIKKVNKAMENLLGYTEIELLDKPMETILSKEFANTRCCSDMKGHVNDMPMVFLTKAGKEIKLAFSGTIMRDSAGKIMGFLGTAKS